MMDKDLDNIVELGVNPKLLEVVVLDSRGEPTDVAAKLLYSHLTRETLLSDIQGLYEAIERHALKIGARAFIIQGTEPLGWTAPPCYAGDAPDSSPYVNAIVDFYNLRQK